MNVLVLGINGFVGKHVARELSERGMGIIGVGNQPELEEEVKDITKQYIACDLINPEEVGKISLSDVGAIINLAGFAKVGDSKGQGELYNRVNSGVHTVLYEECLKQNVTPRIIAVSTGAVYDPDQPMPLTENSALVADDKTNEYVISKKLTEKAVLDFKSRGLRCIIVRPFNHSGPSQLPGFLLPDLAEQIKQSITSGEPIKVGNLDTKRDFTDVRDVARAYAALATCEEAKLESDIYNICSGKSVSGRVILDLLAKAYGIADVQSEVDPAKMRAHDVMDIYGSHERLTQATGWQPEIALEQTIADFAEWHKNQAS